MTKLTPNLHKIKQLQRGAWQLQRGTWHQWKLKCRYPDTWLSGSGYQDIGISGTKPDTQIPTSGYSDNRITDMNDMSRKLLLLTVTIILTLGLAMGNIAHATDYNDVATGSWGSASTWSPAGVPGSGDNVTIDSRGS